MNVISYIRKNGLNKLENDYQIKIKYYNDRIILNYDRDTSPDIKYHPISCECRGLILRYNPKLTHKEQDFQVLCRSFDRFFNYKESPNDLYFDFTSAVYFEKLDGTLINVYFDGKEWQCATRGRAFAEGCIFDKEITYEYFFNKVFIDSYNQYIQKNIKNNIIRNIPENYKEFFYKHGAKEYTYIFELTSPLNRIVTRYTEDNITLLDCRNKYTGEYVDFIQLKQIAHKVLYVNTPKEYNFNGLSSLQKSFLKMRNDEEGYVAVLKGNDRKRIKIKNPAYVVLHKKRRNGKITPKVIINLILENETDEWLATFPEDKEIFDKYINVKNQIINDINNIYETYKNIENQKEFALIIKDKPFKRILFKMRQEYDKPFNLLKKQHISFIERLFNLYLNKS